MCGVKLLGCLRYGQTWVRSSGDLICNNLFSCSFSQINAVGFRLSWDFEVKLSRPPSVLKINPVETNEIYPTTNKSWSSCSDTPHFRSSLHTILLDSIPGGATCYSTTGVCYYVWDMVFFYQQIFSFPASMHMYLSTCIIVFLTVVVISQ